MHFSENSTQLRHHDVTMTELIQNMRHSTTYAKSKNNNQRKLRVIRGYIIV